MEVKTLLVDDMDLTYLQFNSGFQRLETEENRSVIFEIIGYNLIVKWMLPKASRDSDIKALLGLEGVRYFPLLYAYKDSTFLIMEKVKGEPLDKLISAGISNEELKLVRDEFKQAVENVTVRNLYDWDFKLEHLFWNREDHSLKWIDLGLFDP
ncbi:hypothetical protein ACFT6Z_36205, partial [Streptomyces sp. NPDC057131]|uniref:hypothetical protein n=1 Tax=Streptomyces sp. NPDC057131 TaxID=3346027 RepID=UPI003628487B